MIASAEAVASSAAKGCDRRGRKEPDERDQSDRGCAAALYAKTARATS